MHYKTPLLAVCQCLQQSVTVNLLLFQVLWILQFEGVLPELLDFYGLKQNPFTGMKSRWGHIRVVFTTIRIRTARSADREDLSADNLFIQREYDALLLGYLPCNVITRAGQSAVLDSSKSSLVFGSRGSGKTVSIHLSREGTLTRGSIGSKKTLSVTCVC